MNKDLKKSYQFLNLGFNATEEEVLARKKALIKTFNAKELETGKSQQEKIDKVEESATCIIENLKKNSVPKTPHFFETSDKSIVGLIITLCFVAMICYFSFLIYN